MLFDITDGSPGNWSLPVALQLGVGLHAHTHSPRISDPNMHKMDLMGLKKQKTHSWVGGEGELDLEESREKAIVSKHTVQNPTN